MLIEIDGKLLNTNFFKEEQKKVAFDAAKGLTRTAWDAVKEAQSDMSDKFTLRSPWITRGFRVDRATPDKLEATISHRDGC